MTTRTHNARSGPHGFNLFEAIVVTCILSVLIAIFLPALTRPRGCVLRANCNTNLKEMGLAFKQWALDHDDKYPMQTSITNGGTLEWVAYGYVWPHFQVQSNELNTPRILVCPQDVGRTGAGSFTSDFNNSAISYFVGVDAQDSYPQMFLSGDRNLTNGIRSRSRLVVWTTNSQVGWSQRLHGLSGNVLLGDGSVQGFSNSGLRAAFQDTGMVTNRLAFP